VSSAAASTGLPAAVASAVTANPNGAVGGSAAGTGTNGSTALSSTAATASAGMQSGVNAAHGVVRMQDVAQVVDSVEDIHGMGVFNGKRAILVIVFKNSTANVNETVDNVKAMLPRLEASIPGRSRCTSRWTGQSRFARR